MKLLFDSRGNYVAYEDCGRLHSLAGANIGQYLNGEGVFIDLGGRYLGEVVLGNRLLYNLRSPHREAQFAAPGVYGNSGRIGNPGNAGAARLVKGYQDVGAGLLE